MEQRRIPIHRALHRPSLVLGAERDLVMSSGLISLLVGVGGMTIISGLVAVVFWVVSVIILRHMAKADPLMSRVWMRHVKQQDFYSAKGSCWRVTGGFKERT